MAGEGWRRKLIVGLCFALPAAADPPALDAVKEALRDPLRRSATTSALVDRGPSGWLVLQQLALDRSPKVRQASAVGLGHVPWEHSIGALKQMVRDTDRGVAAAAVRALLIQHGETGAPIVRAQLRQDPRLSLRLQPVAFEAAATVVRRELDALIPEDGWIVGTYPGMFDRIYRMGNWATPALLRILGATHRVRPHTTQVLAGEALIAGINTLRADRERATKKNERARLTRALTELDARLKPALKRILESSYRHRRYRAVGEVVIIALDRLPNNPESKYLNDRISWYTNRALRWNWRNAGEWHFRLGMLLLRAGRREAAGDAFREGLRKSNEADNSQRTHYFHYNLACLEALEGRTEKALKHMRAALHFGFTSLDWIERDTRLDSIRRHPRFVRMMAQARDPLEDSSGDD